MPIKTIGYEDLFQRIHDRRIGVVAAMPAQLGGRAPAIQGEGMFQSLQPCRLAAPARHPPQNA